MARERLVIEIWADVEDSTQWYEAMKPALKQFAEDGGKRRIRYGSNPVPGVPGGHLSWMVKSSNKNGDKR